MNKTLITILLLLAALETVAQIPSYRARFRYRISRDQVESLRDRGFPITDDRNIPYQLCPNLGGGLQCLVTQDKYSLSIDPWAVRDERTNYQSNNTDPCYGQMGVINAASPNTLRIQLPARPLVGNASEAVTLHYQSWIFSVNTFGLKIRPRVKTYLDSVIAVTATTATFNLGIGYGYSFGWTTFTHRNTTSYSITPSLSLGFSSVKLKDEPLSDSMVVLSRVPNNFVLSPTFNVIFARNDIGIILGYGKDVMIGRYASTWAYQKKGFIALGIAAGFKL